MAQHKWNRLDADQLETRKLNWLYKHQLDCLLARYIFHSYTYFPLGYDIMSLH